MCSKESSPTTKQLINLHVFQNDFFREAIRSHISEYHTHFCERLISVYVWGSVHRNEAIPRISDLDLHAFIDDVVTESDLQWCNKASKRLEEAFPKTQGLTRPRSTDDLLQGLRPEADDNSRTRTRAFAFRLHYDATLVWGRDLIEKLNIPIPKSRGFDQTPWELTRYAAGLEKENRTDFSLPREPSLRLRKLARLGVLGGSEFLKSQGKFRSYKGAEVIPVLEEMFPEWGNFLEETRAFYIFPTEPTNNEVSEYLSELVIWMDWLKTKLE